MSGGQACNCAEKSEPLVADGNRPARLWRVLQRYCNHSAFNGYHYTPSRYSSVCCLRCGNHWRTKSDYVMLLPDVTDEEINIRPGVAGYALAMEERGR